ALGRPQLDLNPSRPHDPVKDQEHNGARGGDENIDDVAAADSHLARNKATQQTARNADQYGDDDAARIVARHDPFGENARDQADKDPTDYAIFHVPLLLTVSVGKGPAVQLSPAVLPSAVDRCL